MKHKDTQKIKPIEPILPIKAEIEYSKQKQDFMFQHYYMEEIKKRQKPLIRYGHIEVDI